MRPLPTLAKIISSYQTGCFCSHDGDLPRFPDGEPFDTEPRFNFRREARNYAAKHGLEIVAWNKHKGATARLAKACPHRSEQFLRLGWELAR